jgi:hypothetical protein
MQTRKPFRWLDQWPYRHICRLELDVLAIIRNRSYAGKFVKTIESSKGITPVKADVLSDTNQGAKVC